MMHAGYGPGAGHFGNWLCGPGVFFPGPLGWIISLLFWGLVFFLAYKLFCALLPGTGKAAALQTLKERYARGEIDEEQYRRMKTELG